MIRICLFFRKPHYERRGQINKEQIDIFLKEVADAADEFGNQPVINMDETFLLNDYLPNIIIDRKGHETVKAVKEILNLKEGTTFIGSLSLDPHLNLSYSNMKKKMIKVLLEFIKESS